MRPPAGAHRPVGDAEADRRRSRASWSAPRCDRARTARADCAIVDIGYAARARPRAGAAADAARGGDVERPVGAGLRPHRGSSCSEHRTTLVFVNTRRMAERAARHLGERLGKERVAAHHGSLAQGAAPRRRAAPQARRAARCWSRPRRSSSASTSATSTWSASSARRARSPPSCSASAARATPSAACRRGACSRSRATTWSSARRCSTACAAASSTRCVMPRAPLDVLAQQIVAEVAVPRVGRGRAVRRSCAAPGRTRGLRAPGLRRGRARCSPRASRRAAARAPRYLHRDAVHSVCAARRGARLTALTSGGTIPDTGDYDVVLEPQAQHDRHRQRGLRDREPGRRHLPARQRQLPHPARRARPRARRGRAGRAAEHSVLARRGAGRSDELSLARVAPARTRSARGIERDGADAAQLACARADEVGLDDEAARQLVDYLARTHAALGALPTQRAPRDRALLRRVGRHAAGHPLAVRQPHQPRLGPGAAQALLPQVQLRAAGGGDRGRDRAVAVDQPQLPARRGGALPAFGDRARRAGAGAARRAAVRRALALERDHRARAAALRRRQEGRAAAAADEVRGPARRACSPTRSRAPRTSSASARCPTIRWSRRRCDDCLHEAMDVDGWLRAAARASSPARSRSSRATCRRRRRSPPKRSARGRTRSSTTRRSRSAARRRCRRAATPIPRAPTTSAGSTPTRSRRCATKPGRDARNADEMHEALVALGVVADGEVAARMPAWPDVARRGSGATGCGARDGCATADRVGRRRAAAAGARRCIPDAAAAAADRRAPRRIRREAWTRDDALRRAAARAPRRPRSRARRDRSPRRSAAGRAEIDARPARAGGRRLRDAGPLHGRACRARPNEWCERHLLARIHRYTLKRLRREIEPVEPRDFVRFLFDWQRVGAEQPRQRPGRAGGVLAQLEGFEAPAAAWEAEILPARVEDYEPAWLDDLCTAGRVAVDAPAPARGEGRARAAPVRCARRRSCCCRAARWPSWTRCAPRGADDAELARARARGRRVTSPRTARRSSTRSRHGARLLRAELEDALAELVARGRVNCDSFAGLRALLVPRGEARRAHVARAPRAARSLFGHRGRGPLVADAPRAQPIAPPSRRAEPRSRRARRAHPAAPLRRRLLAPARARSGLAAAVARPAARLPPARGARRDPRRPLHRRPVRRAVRAARSDRVAARGARRRRATARSSASAAIDPLNLVGTVVAGAKVPAARGRARAVSRRRAGRDARGEDITWLEPLEPVEAWRVQQALAGRPVAASAAPPVETLAGLHRSRHH